MNKYQLLGEITALTVMINENTNADIFIYVSGHISRLEINIYSDGWDKNKDYDMKESFDFDEDFDEEKCKQIKERLVEFYVMKMVEIKKIFNLRSE